MKQQKAALRTLFVLTLPKYVPLVDDLFQYFGIASIAEGIYNKFRVLPIQWKEELEELAESGWEGSEWFLRAQKRKITWLDENLEYLPIPIYVKPPKRKSKINAIIDEAIMNETLFFKRMEFLATVYAAEIDSIAQGKLGPEATQALGLTPKQIDFIFGSCLQKVVDAVGTLVSKLEALSLVPSEPITEGGRAGVFANIFIECSDTLREGYSIYTARYNIGRKLVESKAAQVRTTPRPRSRKGEVKFLTFIELWVQFTQVKAKDLDLENKTLDTVVGLPVKNFTNYNLYLKEIKKSAKKLDKDEFTIEKLDKALKTMTKVSEEVDKYVKENEETGNASGYFKR